MSIRLLLTLFTLTGSLMLMAGTVQAEQNAAIYLAARLGIGKYRDQCSRQG